MNRTSSPSAPTDSAQDATVDQILDLLATVYWKGLDREICEVVLAFQEIEQHQPSPTPYERDIADISGHNFKQFCTLLTPYVEGDETFNSAQLYSRSIELAKTHLKSDYEESRGRYLLQALGLLDIDVLHDSMDDPTIGRQNHDPHGEVLSIPGDTPILFREMRCEICEEPLREYFYYECEQGCKSSISNLYIEDKKGNAVDGTALLDDLRPPVRLCVACVTNTDRLEQCKRQHCRKVIHSRVGIKGLSNFRARLRDMEFAKGGSTRPHLKKTAYKLVDPSHFANAGPIHFALTMGPLMIENGLRPIRNAQISCRPLPSLRFGPPQIQIISSERDATAASEGTAFTGYMYDDKNSGKRVLETLYKPEKNRRFLASGKKVCGGAFSGHNARFSEGEKEIIRALLNAKSAFRVNATAVGWVGRARKQLHELSQPILDAIEATFGQEINIYLKHFAKVLADTGNRLDWDLRSNNCQEFSTTLLKGLQIGGIFHALPKSFLDDAEATNKKDWTIPRYAMSFGPRIDTPIALLRPQPRSIILNFYRRKRDKCDIIEFGETYRTKPFAFSTESWEVLDGIEDMGAMKMSLVDALWSIPRDSVSILHSHLLRPSSKYANAQYEALTAEQWVQNRLRVLHQLDVFTSLSGGLVSALMEQSAEKRHLLSESFSPSAEEFGIIHAEEKIVKMGTVRGHLIYFVSGRERNWHKQEMKHFIRKLIH